MIDALEISLGQTAHRTAARMAFQLFDFRRYTGNQEHDLFFDGDASFVCLKRLVDMGSRSAIQKKCETVLLPGVDPVNEYPLLHTLASWTFIEKIYSTP